MVNLTKKPPQIRLKDKPPKQNERIPLSVVPPQQSALPIFNSPFYMTPDDPADPRDCDRYPDSIYCGGFPWTWTPVGIEPAIVLDECNVGIELKPILGWTILPPVQIYYRKQTEGCRFNPPPDFEPPKQDPNNLHKFYCGDIYYRLEAPRNITNKDNTGYITVKESPTEYYNNVILPIVKARSSYEYIQEMANYYCTINREGRADRYSVDCASTRIIDLGYNIYYDREELIATNLNVAHHHLDGWRFNYGMYDIKTNEYGGIYHARRYAKPPYEMQSVIIPPYETHHYPINVKPYEIQLLSSGGSLLRIEVANLIIGVEDLIIDEFTLEEARLQCPTTPIISPPLPPPPKRCDCSMTCCPSTTQNDQLLRSLIKKVDKLSSIIGVDDYPIKLPESLISKDEGFLGNLIPNNNVSVPSLTRLAAWYIERFDEIMGQWEIPIEIKDSDPTKPGDQPVGIKLPNIAECMAEMFTLCFQTNINSEVLLNMCMRTLAETGTDKQQNFITYKLLQSLTDWVGYKQKDTVQPMPLSFTLNKTRYDEILKESEVNVPVPEFDEKFGLEADLMRFREAASILQANHKIKINPNGDVKAQILKYLVDTFTNVNKVNGEDAEQDFEDFLEEVETGFINTRGVTNNTNPYGKPFNERPRIRDLTNFETDNPTP